MKVYYHKGDKWRSIPARLPSEQNMLALSFNNWDDYGISTTLNAILYFDGEPFLDFSLKLLIENDKYSPMKLNELCDNGWDGFFPLPNLNYISVPSDIDFYSTLIAKIGTESTKVVLELIRDAGYLKNILGDENAIRLTESVDFSTSPLREAGARKAYKDGWMLFDDKISSIQDFTLNIFNKDGTKEPVHFHFNSEQLPYDINVLIGPNGIGKSFTLKSLVEYWLGVDSGNKDSLEEKGHIPFDIYPNISKLILISYSPFEEFTLDLSKARLMDKEAYKYFGFRKARINTDGDQRIGISRNLPASDSVHSILKALSDDKKFSFMPSWKNKFDTILSVLRPAIGCDLIAFELSENIGSLESIPGFPSYFNSENKRYMPINESVYKMLENWHGTIEECINFQAGAVFIRDGQKVEISSGQRLFCYIVVNVVGQIRKDSLVVIDEPELFLHPTFEIEFIALLKKVLKAFNSKAILATHSLAITREIPAKCIHVYHKRNEKIEIEQPPFETFGGDMQRISSYVFGDSSTSKPYDVWIEEKINEHKNPEELIRLLGNELNEELLIKILNAGAGNGN
ncbi:AAA family ATPase [Chromobacterium vaccinii]|uniref:AAA family ATPase n=1 Tax=Chromobacterium vaccinii TaxID=1108595 RepID=UPI001E34758B|nr:AAA family ATPase [Chromobacterium vaccinii]MCD4502142.1 ATP-binding protein [Chromobacterium vaccinii]